MDRILIRVECDGFSVVHVESGANFHINQEDYAVDEIKSAFEAIGYFVTVENCY